MSTKDIMVKITEALDGVDDRRKIYALEAIIAGIKADILTERALAPYSEEPIKKEDAR